MTSQILARARVSETMKVLEQYVYVHIFCRALGRSGWQKIRWGCRTHEIAAVCTKAGAYRADHGISPADRDRIVASVRVGRTLSMKPVSNDSADREPREQAPLLVPDQEPGHPDTEEEVVDESHAAKAPEHGLNDIMNLT